MQLISKEFCEQNKLKIQPIEQLIECKGVVGTGLLEYDGYVEVNVQIPGRDFSEDHLFLVSSMMNSQKDMPVIVGNFFIDSLNKYLKNLSQEEFETLDKTIQNVYFARIEASRIKEQYGCEPPLGSEELKLEPEEYIPTSCDKTCDQSHTVEIEDLGPDLEEDIEFQNSYTENDKPNLGKSDQPTSS